MTNSLPPGFIPHDGSGCPVPLDSKPDVMFGDGSFSDSPYPMPAGYWAHSFWSNGAPDYTRIIAYKPDPEYGEVK